MFRSEHNLINSSAKVCSDAKYTLKTNGSKQYQKRFLQLVAIAEPLLVLNITFFKGFHTEPCFENATCI